MVEVGHEVGELHGTPIFYSAFFGPEDEASKERGVGFEGQVRLAPFVFQVNEEIFDEVLHHAAARTE